MLEWTGLTPREKLFSQRTKRKKRREGPKPNPTPQATRETTTRKTTKQKAGRGQSTLLSFLAFGSYQLCLEAPRHLQCHGVPYMHPYASGRHRPHRRRCSPWSLATESDAAWQNSPLWRPRSTPSFLIHDQGGAVGVAKSPVYRTPLWQPRRHLPLAEKWR